MSGLSPTPPFLSLARELRDRIYDLLLSTPIATPSPSIPGHLIDVSERYRLTRPALDWHWQIPVSRGSCFGILYTCHQIYAEVVECIESQERRGGMSFELDIAVIGLLHPAESVYFGAESWIWPTWIVLPLCSYPVFLHECKDFANSPLISTSIYKCKNLVVSLKLQSKLTFSWLYSSGLSTLIKNLFTMLARFLLCGPLGLYTEPHNGCVWSIDILSVNILKAGSFTDPYTDQSHVVPIRVIEDSILYLTRYIDELCTKGALSGRVRVVRLTVEGELEHEWLINEGERLSPAEKEDWARYGWTIDAQEIPGESRTLEHTVNIAPERRKWNSCCRVQ
ncbi:hypothetical protein J3R30DRAFT_3706315 [Lentinula aciculospora]|uniref:Uncharacterized protein n=1 Tax=Lentinula aciculospora TaxID=153920 RepID=A0A9W9A6K2_9AGAR|nr:hypothetical protein J3R30DRAFT_3706315 [Lentinula aciculospora]